MRFRLHCSVTVSAFTVVEANTLAEAIEEAEGRNVELCFDGSGVSPFESWCIEDADGEPTDVTVSE